MYVLIIGGGRIGYHLTRALLNADHEVAVIERESSRTRILSSEFGNIAIQGDGSESNVLLSAGVERADVLIATTGNDEDNLAACQIAINLFNVPRTIARINNPENEALFDLLGIHVTVSSTQIILSEIEEELPIALEVDLLPARGNRQVVRIEIPQGSSAIDLPIVSLPLPPETIINAIIGINGELRPINTETLIEAYDEVIAITHSDHAETLLELFAGQN
jgi:trk system potassium uptake protein TrkA